MGTASLITITEAHQWLALWLTCLPKTELLEAASMEPQLGVAHLQCAFHSFPSRTGRSPQVPGQGRTEVFLRVRKGPPTHCPPEAPLSLRTLAWIVPTDLGPMSKMTDFLHLLSF